MDVPLGTGRFLKYFGVEGNTVYGVDISKDMITQAESKWKKYIPRENQGCMQVGDVFDLPFDNKTIDHTVCIRLLNWMNINEVGLILQEFKRVSNDSIVVSIRVNQKLSIVDWLNFNNLATIVKKINIRKMFKRALRFLGGVNKSTNSGRGNYNPSSGYVHNKNAIQDIIRELGLKVREVHLIEQRILLFKKVSQPFLIYWLDVPKEN